jgi:hypothetical protein
LVVPSFDVLAPPPAVGWALVSGGQFVTHAPEQLLLVPVSAPNTYSVLPWELSRILPRLVLSTPSVAALPLEVFGGGLAAVALLLSLPPQLARARAVRGITAALASNVRGVRDINRAPLRYGFKSLQMLLRPASAVVRPATTL